ncbi:MAG TPA: hypothetical protein VGC09_06775, partial [Rhodopila sp.]
MDAISALSSPSPGPVDQVVLARAITPVRRMADAIRALAIDAIEQSKGGSLDLPMGMADVATALWTRFHKFDAADPRWPDRDRFVLSAGHGSMLLYALIYLTGHAGMSIEDIRNFRRLHSPATGHPEYGQHPAIEASTGPPGQGLATAVGMAIAERNMAARFGKSLVDHRTWVIASESDMMEGISHEAAALAGHLALSKLTVMYDHGDGPAEGDAAQPGSEDVLKRFAACGWATKQVDAHDPAQINAVLSFAVRSKKPTVIACRTAIIRTIRVQGIEAQGTRAQGIKAAGLSTMDAAVRAGGNGTHDAARVAGEEPDLRALLGWHEPAFVTPDDVRMRWYAAGSRGATARRSWLKRLARHNQRAEFERVMTGRLPDNWHEAVADLKQDIADTRPKLATCASSQRCLESFIPAAPELIGGSADQAGSGRDSWTMAGSSLAEAGPPGWDTSAPSLAEPRSAGLGSAGMGSGGSGVWGGAGARALPG